MLTAKEFIDLGDDPHGARCELVRGRIEVNHGPLPPHSFTETMLSTLLDGHIAENDHGELYGRVNTILGDRDVRRPDLVFVAKEQRHLATERAIEGPPDLCVEIISPTSVKRDREDKFRQYESAGVPHYWIVEPLAHTFEAYRLEGGRYVLAAKGKENDTVHAPPFEGLALTLKKIWWPKERR